MLSVEPEAPLTFRQGLDGVDYGLRDAHLLDADVWRVEEHLGHSKALVGQPQDLFPRLVLSTEDHLLWWLVGTEEDTNLYNMVTPEDEQTLQTLAHLAEALFNGAEIWENVIPHHGVLLPLEPEDKEASLKQHPDVLTRSLHRGSLTLIPSNMTSSRWSTHRNNETGTETDSANFSHPFTVFIIWESWKNFFMFNDKTTWLPWRYRVTSTADKHFWVKSDFKCSACLSGVWLTVRCPCPCRSVGRHSRRPPSPGWSRGFRPSRVTGWKQESDYLSADLTATRRPHCAEVDFTDMKWSPSGGW